MSPEQWSGESVDARSDQFGLCVMFFEALHGRRPFVAQSEAELADLVMRGAIQPASDAERAERPVPDWLDEIVLRGLSPDPATRFPDMHDLVDTLTRCASCARHLTDARDALHQARRQQSSFPAHAAVASVAISNALDARPDSDDARAVRAELLESWFAYDLGQGALDAAAAHLAGLPGRSDLQRLLSDARASAAEQSERLAKLSELERDADPSVGLNVKVRILLVQAPLWALVFWGLGAATRQGWLHAGHFAAIFVAHIVSTVLAVRAQPEIWMPNRVARRVIELSVTNQLGTVLMMLYAWFAGVDLATAFLFVQLMLTAFWLGAGLVLDRGMFFVAGVAFAAAVFMHYVPAYAVDAYGVATAIALVGLALSWARGGKRRED